MTKTLKAFATLKRLHAVLGTMPCDWQTYRAEMVTTYGLDGATLDAMARLGHFHVTTNGVAFYA